MCNLDINEVFFDKIWVKAEELFMLEQVRTMDCDIKPERNELREGGYYERAKTLILREVSNGNL